MQDLDGNTLEQAWAEGDQDRGVELDLDGTTWVDDHAVFTIARDPNDAAHNTHTIIVTLRRLRHGKGSASTPKKASMSVPAS